MNDTNAFEKFIGFILIGLAFVACTAVLGLAVDLTAFFIRHFTFGF
jgi:hypothetical protein